MLHTLVLLVLRLFFSHEEPPRPNLCILCFYFLKVPVMSNSRFFLSFDVQDCERRHMAKLFHHRMDEKRNTRKKAIE